MIHTLIQSKSGGENLRYWRADAELIWIKRPQARLPII
jgi:hypothetical protein